MMVQALMETVWIYPLAAFFIFFDAICPLLPSEIILNLTGAYSGATGTPDLLLMGIVATLAAVAGDNMCFFLGTRLMPFINRVRPGTKAHGALMWVRRNMRRGAGAGIMIARFIPSARFFMTILLGSVRYPWPLFFFFDTIGVILWVIQGLGIGYLGGMAFKDNVLLAMVVSVILAVIVGVLVQRAQVAVTEWIDTRRGYAETP